MCIQLHLQRKGERCARDAVEVLCNTHFYIVFVLSPSRKLFLLAASLRSKSSLQMNDVKSNLYQPCHALATFDLDFFEVFQLVFFFLDFDEAQAGCARELSCKGFRTVADHHSLCPSMPRSQLQPTTGSSNTTCRQQQRGQQRQYYCTYRGNPT